MSGAGGRDARGTRGTQAAALALAACACAGVLALVSCAPKAVEPATTLALRFPDFLFPSVPQGAWGAETVALHERGWRFLQGGEVRDAERAFRRALQLTPPFYPAETGLGYVRLAERSYAAALAEFDRALRRAEDYVPALVGRGDALLGVSRPREALESFKNAIALDPSLAEVRRRADVVSLRLQQDALAAARRAVESGDYEGARQAYLRAIDGSPDSAFLYRDVAAVERLRGNAHAALQHLRKAVDLDAGDARSWIQIGELLEEQKDFDGAAAAYLRAAQLEPGAAADVRLERVRGRAVLARLPAAYQHIPASSQITRGDLAALVGIRLEPLLQRAPAREAVVITDVRGHWAAFWIQAVIRAGVMEVYPNHEFQPEGPVRRADLAVVASRMLQIVGAGQPRAYQEWQRGRPGISDVPAGNVYYAAVALVVTAAVMPLVEGDAFQPARPMSGAEALDVLGRLEVLGR